MGAVEQLAANLIEISYSKGSDDLVAFRNRIYHRSYGFGRVIVWLRRILPFLAKDKQHTLDVCENTRKLFFLKIQELEVSVAQLKNALERRLSGKKVDSSKLGQAKENLLQFSHYFDPLMKDVRKGREEKILSFLTSKAADQKKIRRELKQLFQELHIHQKIFTFEKVTDREFPLDLIKKMSFNDSLSSTEQKRVYQWIERLDHLLDAPLSSFYGSTENAFVKGRYMHRMLCQIVAFINHHFPKEEEKGQEIAAEIGVLESTLVEYGYRAFEEADVRHIVWRETLTVGEELFCNNKKYILGEIAQNAEGKPDEPVVFSIRNEPSLEVIIYPNESLIYLNQFKKNILHCGVKGRRILGVSAFGRIVIQERLYDSLAKLPWSTAFNGLVREHDKIVAKPLIQLIKGLASREHFTPHPLIPESFAFNAHNELRATTLLTPELFNFLAIEKFVWECVKGNPSLFSYVISESQLGRLTEARYFQELFVEVLVKEVDREKAISRNTSISDEHLKSVRKEFYSEVNHLFEKYLSTYRRDYEDSFFDKWKMLFIKKLIEKQKLLCPGRILVSTLFPTAYWLALFEHKAKLKESKLRIIVERIQKEGNFEPFLKKDDTPLRELGIFHPGQIKKARNTIQERSKKKAS
ncbi:hypothetical protein PHSC3_000861 [Chlamydiales bacterium STE3]|nr:hypothetical protein PHSC3_000861 [Chlamydiales bacterium STE3]